MPGRGCPAEQEGEEEHDQEGAEGDDHQVEARAAKTERDPGPRNAKPRGTRAAHAHICAIQGTMPLARDRTRKQITNQEDEEDQEEEEAEEQDD